MVFYDTKAGCVYQMQNAHPALVIPKIEWYVKSTQRILGVSVVWFFLVRDSSRVHDHKLAMDFSPVSDRHGPFF